MVKILPGIPEISAGETDDGAVDFTDRLDSGETLSGTPTVTEVTSSDLTISSVAVNTATLTMFDTTIAIGAAVQFTVSGQLASTLYTLNVTTSTSASRTFVRRVSFYCVS